jgi:hypothetical protein
MVERDLAKVDTRVRFPSPAPLELDEKYIVLLFYYYFDMIDMLKKGVFMNYNFGFMGLFVGLYSLFLFVLGISVLILIWVTILFILKKMKKMDQ